MNAPDPVARRRTFAIISHPDAGHTSVTGRGVIISDLEARLRRVEQHLNLSGPDAH